MDSKFKKWMKRVYIHLILLIFYIPLFFTVIFSFNKPTKKGYLKYTWNGFTTQNWATFFDQGRGAALLNSILVALVVSTIVVTFSLITCFGMWRQKNEKYGKVLLGVNNIPLINPDNIIAIGLVLLFSALFGTLASTKGGLLRGIAGHSIMALPYGITMMFPRSEKFNKNQLEAAQDLGYNKFRAWFKTYFVYMLPTIVYTLLVSAFMSFDDFIIMKTLSNTPTLGTKLYEGEFRSWGLVVGAALLILVILGNLIYISYKSIRISVLHTKIEKNRKDELKKMLQIQNKIAEVEV